MAGVLTTSMRVLTTGGAGYIGSVAVRALGVAGHEVVVLDTLEHGRRDRVLDARLIVGDVGDEALVADVLRSERIEAVMHFAAYRSVEESNRDPERYRRNNVDGSRHLFGAMARSDVAILVHSSTCAVYGSPMSLPVAEETPLDPLSPYASGKLEIETMIADLAAEGLLRPVVLRYFNAAGAVPEAGLGESPGRESLIARTVAAAEAGHAMRVFGTDYPTRDGTAIRDFVHVEDLAQAHLLALELASSGGPAETINLGSGIGSTVLEVIRAVEIASGRRIEWEPAPRRAGDPAASLADIRRASRVLGWTPRRSLDDIAASAWNHAAGAVAPA